MRWDVSEDVQNAVLAQSDLSLWADWLKKAVEAESPEDIFQEIVQWKEWNSEAEMEKIERGMPQEWKREAKKRQRKWRMSGFIVLLPQSISNAPFYRITVPQNKE